MAVTKTPDVSLRMCSPLLGYSDSIEKNCQKTTLEY